MRDDSSRSPPPPTAEASAADILQSVQAAGVLQPKVKVEVGAQVSGQIQRILVQLGQPVKKGDLLVKLDPELARSEVIQAEAALAQQIAVIESRQADLKFAEAELARQQRLLAGEATTSIDAERADTELIKLRADLRGQNASLKRLQAELDKRQVALGYTSIRAPIDGVVVSLPVQEGQAVTAVQATPVMMTLANLSEITVRARVAEADIHLVRVGQLAHFVTLAGESQRYRSVVRVVQPVPDRAGNAVFYNVLFDVDNRDRRLLPDMTVHVVIETGKVTGVLTIPVVALGERGEDGRFTVWVLDRQGRQQARKVRVGLQDGARVQVLDGVVANERIILAPAPKGEPAAKAASP